MSIQALSVSPELPAVSNGRASLSPETPSLARAPKRTVALPHGVADLTRAEIRHDDGRRDELSARETELLGYLAANADRPVSRDEILQRVWRLNPRRLITRTIDMHIANLRDKLRDDPGHPRVLVTVRGRGYMFASRSGA
jgi:DNA-binding response OmpR family regulator